MRPGGYDDGQPPLEVLTGLDAIRRRPGMYVGDTSDGSGLERAVLTLVRRALDDGARAVEVRLRADGAVEVTDDGAGMAVTPLVDGRSPAEVALTTMRGQHLRAGPGRFDDGLLPAVTALAARLELEIHRAHAVHRQSFARGVALRPLESERVEAATPSGTRLTWWPDAAIFGTAAPPCSGRLGQALAELALQMTHGTLTLVDERVTPEIRHLAHALAPLVRRRSSTRVAAAELSVEVALGLDGGVRCFCNGVANEGGSHLDGLRQAFVHSLTSDARTGWRELDRVGAVVGVWYAGARSRDATHAHLASPEVAPVVEAVAREARAALVSEQRAHLEARLAVAEDGLVARLRATPDDAAAALVWADRLQAAGDPRGELVALEHTLASAIDIDAAARRLVRLLDEERPRLWGVAGGFPVRASYRGRRFVSIGAPSLALDGDDAAARHRRLRAFFDALTDCRGPSQLHFPPMTPALRAQLAACGFVRKHQLWRWRDKPPLHNAVEALLAAGVVPARVDYAFQWSERALGALTPLQSGVCYARGALVSSLGVELAAGRAGLRFVVPLAGADERARFNAWRDAVQRFLPLPARVFQQAQDHDAL